MVSIPQHRIYKMISRELELFSLVKMWLRGDITQILTMWEAVTKMWNLSNSNITKIHHHKLQPASLRLNIRKICFPRRGGQCVSMMLRNTVEAPSLEDIRMPAEPALMFVTLHRGGWARGPPEVPSINIPVSRLN